MDKILEFLLRTFLVPLSLVLTLTALLTVVLPLWIIRLISILSSKVFLPKRSRVLSPISSIFTSDNFDKPRCTLILAAVIDGKLAKEEVLNRLNLVLDSGLYPELRQRLRRWLGFWFWEDCPDFDHSNHLKFQDDLSSKLDEQEVKKLRKDLLKRPFNVRQPLWEIWIHPYQQQEPDHNVPKTIAIFRIHHCTADGYSLLNVMRDFNETKVEISKPSFLQRSWKQKVLFWSRFIILTPTDLVISNIRARDRNSFKIKEFSGDSFGYEADGVRFETLRQISKKYGVSVSAVIFAGFTAGIREAFLQRKWTVPEKFHVPCALPVDMKFGERKNLTNVMTVIPFPSPVNEPDPIRRLRKIEKTFKRKKNTELALGYSLLFQLAGIMSSLFRIECGSTLGSAFWTNFPGPKNQQYVFGRKIDSFRLSADFHNDSVAFGFASICFNGNVLISCKAEKNLFPEPGMTKEFVERVVAEYKFLEKFSFSDDEFV